MESSAPCLVLDTASPIVSIALGGISSSGISSSGTTLLAERTLDLRRSSEGLLRAIEEVLDEGNSRLKDLGGVVVLRGPGSFTGLRIGLSTVLGLHQALGLPATTLDTADVLAVAACDEETAHDGKHDEQEEWTITVAIDALRGEWWTRSYRAGGADVPTPLDEGGLCDVEDLLQLGPVRLIGFGVESLPDEIDAQGIERRSPPPLAPRALSLIKTLGPPAQWDASRLTRPLYHRAPAVNAR